MEEGSTTTLDSWEACDCWARASPWAHLSGNKEASLLPQLSKSSTDLVPFACTMFKTAASWDSHWQSWFLRNGALFASFCLVFLLSFLCLFQLLPDKRAPCSCSQVLVDHCTALLLLGGLNKQKATWPSLAHPAPGMAAVTYTCRP